MFLKNWTKGVVNSINAMLTKKVKVSKFTFSPLILGASVLSLFLCVILGVKIYSVFALDAPIYQYTENGDTYKYYVGGYTIDDGELNDTNYEVVDLSGNNSLCLYSYGDGMAVLLGEGNLKDNLNIKNEIKQKTTKAVCSTLGFKPNTLKKLFCSFTNLTSFDGTNMVCTNIQSYEQMFESCVNLESVTFPNSVSENTTSICEMFRYCESLTDVNLANLNGANVIDAMEMFSGCTSLKNITFPSVTFKDSSDRLSSAFLNCSSLETVSFANGINTSKVTSIGGMFNFNSNQTNLVKVDFSNCNFSNVTSSNNLWGNAKAVEKIILPIDVPVSHNIPLPTKTGYLWMGYLGDTEVSSKTYTSLPKASSGEVDNIRLVIPKIYTDQNGVNYYVSSTSSNSINFIKSYDISKNKDKSLMAYLYDNGLLILDGSGNLFETNYDNDPKVVMPYVSDSSNFEKITKVAFSDNGFKPNTCKGLFAGLTKLEQIVNEAKFDISLVTDLSNMFNNCTSLMTCDLSSFNFDNVTSMNGMFANCSSMVNGITWPSCHFNNTVDISNLYYGCSKLEVADFSTFDLSNNKYDGNATNVFTGCNKLNKVLLPSNVKQYNYTGDVQFPVPMHFNKYKADGTKYDEQVYLALTSKQNDGDYLGKDDNTLLFTDDNGTSETTDDVKYYLYGDETNNILVDSVSYFDTSNYSFFAIHYNDGMLILQGTGNIPVDSNNVLSSNSNIKQCKYKNNTTKAACSNYGFRPNTLGGFFYNFEKLVSFDTTNLNCSDVITYREMFSGCSKLKSVSFPNSISNKTTGLYQMFYNCSSLETVDLKNLNGATINLAGEMFEYCSKLESVNFPSVTVGSSYAKFNHMFRGCTLLESVSFANGINTSNLNNIESMFSDCTILKTVDFSNCDFSNVNTFSNLWYSSTSGSTIGVEKIILPSAVPASYNIPLPTKTGYLWMGYNEETQVPSKTYTYLPAREDGVVDNIRLVEEPPIYIRIDDKGTPDTSDDDTYKYYVGGYKKKDEALSTTNYYAYDITDTDKSSVGSCMAYYYNDGMLIFDGAGATKMYASNNLPWSGKTINYIAISVNGFKPTAMSNLFSNTNIKTVENLDKFDASEVTMMNYLFYNCENLESINFPSTMASTIDTSKFSGQSIDHMFSGCKNLTELDLSMFNTSNITCLYYTFGECTNLQTLNLSGLDLSKLQSSLCNDVFKSDSSLNKIILPNTVADGVVDLPTKQGYVWMGYNGETPVPSKIYTKLPHIELDGESNVVVDNIRLVEPPLLYEYNDGTDNYKYYVGGYKKNNGSFNTNGYVKFDLSVSPSPANSICAYLYDDGMLVLDGQGNVNTGYGELFRSDSYNTKIKKAATSINGFEPDSCENLFDGLSSLTKVDLSTIDTSSSTSMKRMFYGCYALSSLDLSMFDTANVISMSSMFQGCTLLTSLNLSNFNTLNVNDMSIMFNACVNLSSLDLSSFNTTNVINMSNMFSSCSKLTTLTLGSNFITNNVTSMYAMFSKCKMLSSINVSNFNTSKVEDMSYMFEECNALSELDDLNFNTSSVKNMKCMFKNCNTLSELNVSSFDTSEVETIESMFEGCSNLTTLTLQINDNNLTTAKDAIFGLTKLETLDLRGSVFNKNITNNYLYIAGLTNVSKIYIPKTVDGGAVNLMDLPSGKSWVLFNIDGSAASSSLQTYLTGYSSDGVDTSKEGMYLGLGIPIDLATASFPDVTYNGAIQTPSFTLTYNSTPLVLDTDYEIVEWGNNKDACLSTDTNAPYVKIKGKGTYAGETTINFTINKMPLTIDLVNNTDIANFINSKKTKSFNDSDDIKISENENNIFIPGASSTLGLMLNITGKFNDKYVNTANKVKYTFTLSDNTDKLSNYQVTFTPSLDADDSYEVDGSITKLVISFNELNNLMDDFNNATKEYDGDDKVRWSSNTRQGDNSILETNIGGYGLMQYYIITGKYTGNTDNTAVGTNKTYTLHLEFDTTKENYELVSSNLSIPSEYQDWTYNNGSITAQKFKDSNVTVTGTTYTGSVATPSVEVKIGDKTLVFGTDYTFTTTNIDATNNAEVVVTGIGNYAGSNVTKSYTISPYAIEVDVTTYALKDGKTTISKVYDGTKNVLEQINEQLDGVNNEKVCISCSGEYDTKDAGDNKDITYTCTFSGVTGGQANKNNYIVTFKDETSGVVTLDGIGTIIKKQIAMDWSTFNNLTKVYDGDNIVKFNNSGTLEITKTVMQNTGVGEAPNEEQIKVIVSGTYSSSSVNTHTYTLNASLDDSFDANKNYELTDNTNKEFTNGNITNFDMTDSSIVITANYTNTFEYDSTNKSSEISINDFAVTKDGDSVSLDEFTLVFDDPDSDYTNCGTHKFKLKAKDGGNYSGEKEFTFTITQRKIKANDITLDTYSNSNPLVKEYDKTLNLKDGVTPTLRYVKRINDNLSLDIILDYDLTNSKYDSISGRDKDNLDNKDPRDKRDLIFSNVKLKSSDTNYVLVDNDGTTVLDKFNSLSFDDCGQIIDTTKPVITSSAKSVTTVGKGGTLRITLTCSEDLVHDFSVTGFDASKLYIELFSKEANVSYGKAIINTDVSLTKDNVLVFDYSVPTDDQKFEDIRIAGFTIELQNQSGVSLTDDCGNELVTDSLSNDVINTFDDLVIDTRGIALNIKAYSDSTFTNEINRDSITNLFDIYYKFIFGDDVSGFDASDIDVTNGTLSEFIKVDDKTYTCKVSNIGKLSATDTDGIIQSVSVAKDKAQDNNGNFNVSDTLNLTIKRNLIIKDETLLLNIPGLDAATKVIIKTNDILNKVSYSLYEIFNNVTGTTNFASGDTLTITDITTNGLIDRYIIKVNGHKDDYISTEETFTYLIKNIDHIAKEIIDKVLPSLNQSDNDLRSIIKNNDNKEIYELPADVRDILTNDTTNKVTDLIIVGIKDLITDKHVDELDDSSVIKDDIKDLITEIARLGDKIDDIITDAMDYEQRMITYQSLTIVQKEYMYRHYHDEIENLHTKYYELIESCKSNTIESLDNDDSEVVEVYGVINKLKDGLTQDDTDDVRTLSVDKIKEEEKLNKINDTLENKGLLTDKKVIIPYDIKILLNGIPVEHVKTDEKLLIKLKLPIEFFDAVFKIYHLDKDYNFKEEIDLTKQLINGECLIYFFADSFSPYIPVSNLRTLRIETNNDTLGTVNPKGLQAVNVGENKTITVNPNNGYEASITVNGTKVKEKFSGSYTITNIQENLDVFVEFTMKEEPTKPDEPKPEKPSITNATVITIQTANHVPYINGYSDKTFRPNNNMTRAEFSKVIATISNNFSLSYDNDKYIDKYKDVKDTSWYSSYVGYVTKIGLMKGYSDGTFKPNEYITRAEASKVLSDMFNVPDKQIENIFFNELNGHWYFNSTNELIKGGVIKGYSDGTFKANKNITRAEVISLINRVKDRTIVKDIDKGYQNMMDNKFKDVSKSNWFYNDLLEAAIAHNSQDLHK